MADPTVNDAWKNLVVLLECSLDARGKVAQAAERVKSLVMIGAQSSEMHPISFVSVKRRDLVKKAKASSSSPGTDARALATALRQIIKQDRLKALAKLQKSPDAPSIGRVYLLDGFPATAEEASALIPESGNEQVLDVVVELRGGLHEVPYTAPNRTDSSTSYGAKSLGLPPRLQNEGMSKDESSASLPPLSKGHLDPQQVSDLLCQLETQAEIEQNGMKLQLAEKLLPGKEPIVNHVVSALKVARSAARSPGWADVAFLEMNVVQQSSLEHPDDFLPSVLLQKFGALMGNTIREKYRFRAFLASCRQVQIPKLMKPIDQDLLEVYHNNVPTKTGNPHSVEMTLCTMIEALETAHDLNRECLDDARSVESSSQIGEVCNTIQKAAPDPVIFFGDEQALLNLDSGLSEEARELCEKIAIPCKPGNSKQGDDETLATTEFGNFHTFSTDRLQYIRIIQEFEAMLTKADSSAEWNFSNRTRLRELPTRTVLPQALGSAIAEGPAVLQRTSPRTPLLVALHRYTPPSRQCTFSQSPFAYTSLRPSFCDWPSLQSTDPTQHCVFDVSPEPIRALEHSVTMLYPADESLIQLDQFWCTVFRDGHRFGLRRTGFYSAFDTGAFLGISRGPECAKKPDKLGTVVAEYTTSDGLQVRACSNGLLAMTLDGETRVIHGHGAVALLGQKRVLFPNGQVSNFGQDVPTEFTVENSTALTDPESGATVLARELDGTTLVMHQDGSTLACFMDGTKIWRNRGQGLLRIEAPGFGSIKIDMNFESTAQKLSRGDVVDISQGGQHVRSTTLLPDATVIRIEYDTRVTATVNGMLRISSSDGTFVEAWDSGKVEWRPWNVKSLQRNQRKAFEEMEESKKLHSDARESPDRSLGCFVFGLDDDSLRYEDWERNHFCIVKACCKQRKVEVKLSGAFDPVQAVVNRPLEPRLFCVLPSHSFELLTPEQVEKDRKRIGCRMCSTFEPLQVDGSAILYTKTDFPHLFRCDEYIVPLMQQQQIANNFGSASVRTKPLATPSIVYDKVRQVDQVTKAEREELSKAETEFVFWKRELLAEEDRFKVEDTRPASALQHEEKLHQQLHKMKRKVARAKRRQQNAAACHEACAPVKEAGDASVEQHQEEEGGEEQQQQQQQHPHSDEGESSSDCEHDAEEKNPQDDELSSPVDDRPTAPPPRNIPISQGLKYSFT